MNGQKVTNILAIVVVIISLSWFVYEQAFEKEEDLYSDYFSKQRSANVFAFQEEKAEGQKRMGYGVSSSHPIAVQVGMNVLENGGNAVDAAIAVSYAIATVEPYGSGVGGGGLMLVHDPEKNDTIAYDYREMSALSGEMTYNNIGFPGFVYGMEKVHKEYGEVPLEKLIEPSIFIAENGFQADLSLAQQLSNMTYYVSGDGVDTLYPNGRHHTVYEGDAIYQHELAETLRFIQEKGAKGFYQEWIYQDLLEYGFTDDDITSYKVIEKIPAKGTFNGYEVHSAPAPLTGVTLIQSLQMIEMLENGQMVDSEEDFIHLVGEVIKKTYADRLSTLGDPSFVAVDQSWLTSIGYSEQLARDISANKLLGQYLLFDSKGEYESDNTTHFSIVDSNGMMVSATHSLSEFFGSGIYVKGFFINNQLKNFSDSPDSPNVFEAGKRPRSFITPSIILKDGNAFMGIGSPGGKRIPMMLTQVLTEVLLHGEELEAVVEKPRFYIENNRILLEKEKGEVTIHSLQELGYSVSIDRHRPLFYGGIQAIVQDPNTGKVWGAGDSRRDGAWDATQSPIEEKGQSYE